MTQVELLQVAGGALTDLAGQQRRAASTVSGLIGLMTTAGLGWASGRVLPHSQRTWGTDGRPWRFIDQGGSYG
jgi:hypothetical protein